MVEIETIDVGQSAQLERRRRLPPVGASLGDDGLGDRIMLLDGIDADERMVSVGGPTELDDAVLGDLGNVDPETSEAAEADDASDELASIRPRARHGGRQRRKRRMPPRPVPTVRRKQALRELLGKRRGAMSRARWERVQLERRVSTLDNQIADVLRPQQERARASGRTAEHDRLTAEIDRLDLVRGVAAARVLRYARTEALAQVLFRNGRTQLNLLELAERAQKRGRSGDERTLRAAVRDVGKQTARLKGMRRKQVRDWRHQTAASRLALARLIRQRAEREARTLQVRSSRGQQTRALTLTRLSSKMRSVEARERAKLADSRVECADDAADLALVTTGLEGLGLGDLGFFSKLTKYAKRVGGAVTGGARKIGRKLGQQVNRVGQAAGSLLQRGACTLSKNPSIMKAAGGAAGAFAGGPAGAAIGAKGSAVAGRLLSSACPTKPAPQPARRPTSPAMRPMRMSAVLPAHASASTLPTTLTKTAPAPSDKSAGSKVPMVVGGTAAAAALTALLFIL